MQVSVITPGSRADAALRSAVERLIVELNPENPPLPRNLDALLADQSARLLVAAEKIEPGRWPGDSADCAGMLTLTFRNSLSRVSAHIDHVAVDPARRRQGIARLLVEEALDVARAHGASRLDLTSASHRQAAHALYESMGFEQRQTTNWRYWLG